MTSYCGTAFESTSYIQFHEILSTCLLIFWYLIVCYLNELDCVSFTVAFLYSLKSPLPTPSLEFDRQHLKAATARPGPVGSSGTAREAPYRRRTGRHRSPWGWRSRAAPAASSFRTTRRFPTCFVCSTVTAPTSTTFPECSARSVNDRRPNKLTVCLFCLRTAGSKVQDYVLFYGIDLIINMVPVSVLVFVTLSGKIIGCVNEICL